MFVHAIRRPRLRRAVIAGSALLSTVVVAAAPAAALPAENQTRPFVAVVDTGVRGSGGGPPYDGIRIERVQALGPADAARRVDRETGGAPILALDVDTRAAAADVGLDPLRSSQWALDQLGFEAVRAAVEPSAVTVAVVDTGVDATHEDLAGTVLPGWDVLTEGPGGDTDSYGHGTHVAGIVAALAGNGVGGSGAAAGVHILPVRVLDDEGKGWSSTIAEGIRWAADHGADVINLSLGGTTPSGVYRAAIDYAVNSRGAVVVVSAGNDYQTGNPTEYPATDPDAIAVGASTASGSRASFSSTGSYVALSAPGTSILAPCPPGSAMCRDSSGYARLSGTSMAAPFVSAAAALLRAARPDASVAQIRAWLTSTATDAGVPGRDDEFGAGIIDPVRALSAAAGAIAVPIGGRVASPSAGSIEMREVSAGAAGAGYWMVGADGVVYGFGDARALGDAPVGPASAVDLEPTGSGRGYWVVDDTGRVFAFGDAAWRGNVDRARLVSGERITSLSATPSGAGYWVFTTRGRVLAFGDAPFLGDVSAVGLSGAVLDSVPTPTGAGYYLVAADGGIFAFGDARFAGSMGGRRLNAPVESLVPDPDGSGYWLVASDGGIFAFDAGFFGSMGGQRLNRPISGMVSYGSGYLMVGEDGGVFAFSDLAFAGSLAGRAPARPIVAVAPGPSAR
ncbi:MAG TPA: S8 family serine peptidase [Acidimicrobiia bacterium]|nr:S8 family serine peptidase [Acidimicrobiia bacterium]